MTTFTPDAPVPPAGSGYAMDFALSSMRLTADGVEMSGFGAPFFTATAIHPFAIKVALPGTTLPDAITSASCGNSTIPTSNGSPLTIVSLDSM